jgi:hypothetical protein
MLEQPSEHKKELPGSYLKMPPYTFLLHIKGADIAMDPGELARAQWFWERRPTKFILSTDATRYARWNSDYRCAILRIGELLTSKNIVRSSGLNSRILLQPGEFFAGQDLYDPEQNKNQDNN